jgi:hypothetical protein
LSITAADYATRDAAKRLDAIQNRARTDANKRCADALKLLLDAAPLVALGDLDVEQVFGLFS